MRKVLLIALNALTRLSRDRKALIMLILMPMILIAILGTALKSLMGEGKINPVDVAVINADQAAQGLALGQMLTGQVLGSDQVKEILNVKTATDLDAAKRQVADGKLVAVIYVPQTFTADVVAGKAAQIEVWGDPAQPTFTSIVQQIVGSFTDQVTTGSLATRVAGPQGAQQLVQTIQAGLPKVVNAPSGARLVEAIQYYSAAMAIMFMVMTAFTRARMILQDRDEGTLARILISPTGKGAIIAGQMVGTVIVLLAQFLVLMLGTRLIFGVDWGPWGPALLLGFAFAVAAAGIGTAAAGIVTDPKAADAMVGIVSNLFAALSGSMFPLYIFPPTLKLVAHFTPNYWALQGFLDQMSGLGTSYLWTPVAVLAAIGLATGGLGAWRLASK
jgi:ABC-2 type transport system permease protein